MEPKLGRLDHITFWVGDLERAERFYTEVLGGKVRARLEGTRAPQISMILADNSAAVDLCLDRDFLERTFDIPERNKQKAYHPHFAFAVEKQDIEAFTEHLKVMDVPFDGPRTHGGERVASIYFNDPWGNHLEICCNDYSAAGYPLGGPDQRKLIYPQNSRWR